MKIFQYGLQEKQGTELLYYREQKSLINLKFAELKSHFTFIKKY